MLSGKDIVTKVGLGLKLVLAVHSKNSKTNLTIYRSYPYILIVGATPTKFKTPKHYSR